MCPRGACQCDSIIACHHLLDFHPHPGREVLGEVLMDLANMMSIFTTWWIRRPLSPFWLFAVNYSQYHSEIAQHSVSCLAVLFRGLCANSSGLRGAAAPVHFLAFPCVSTSVQSGRGRGRGASPSRRPRPRGALGRQQTFACVSTLGLRQMHDTEMHLIHDVAQGG